MRRFRCPDCWELCDPENKSMIYECDTGKPFCIDCADDVEITGCPEDEE